MSRNIPPQLVTYAESSFVATGTVTTKTLSWLRGDVVVVIHGNEGTGGTLGVPTTTGSGLSFIVQQDNTASSTSAGKISTAIATADSSGTISATNPANTSGLSVWIWRGSDGIGNSAMSSTTSPVVSMTPSDTHSAICYGTFDFHVDTLGLATPRPTTVRQANVVATHYVCYTSEIQDQASANATNWGVMGGTQVGPFTNLAVEVLGTTSPIPKGPVKVDASLGALNTNQGASQLVRTSTGNLYAAIITSGDVRVYKSVNNGVSWVQKDYLNVPPTSATNAVVAAAIDGSDNIHIAFAPVNTLGAYVKFNTTTDTYGQVEPVLQSGGASKVAQSMAIAVDSNGIPHIAETHTAASISSASYSNRISGTWLLAAFQLETTTNAPIAIDIQIDNNNVPEISYSSTNGIIVRLGDKNNPSAFSTTTVSTGITKAGGSSLTIDASGNTWLVWQGAQSGLIQLAKHIKTDAWATWQPVATNGFSGKNVSLAADLNNIYVFYERNLGGLAYDRYDTINSNWLGEQILQAATPSFLPHNPFVKWSQYFNNGDTGANNLGQQTIEYLFDDGSTIYYDKLLTAQISVTYADFKFTPSAGATTTSTSSTSSSTSTSTSTSSTSSSTSVSTSSTSSSISTSSTSSSVSTSTSSTSKSTSTSSTSSSTSVSTSSTSSSISTSTSSTSSSISTSSTSSSTSISTSISTSTSSTSSSISTSISTSSTSSSISTSSTSSSVSTSSTSSSISTSTSSTSSSISTSTSSTSSSISTSTSFSTSSTSQSTSTSRSTSTSSTSSSVSTSTSSTSSSTSQSTSTSSTSSSTSTSQSTSTSSTSSSISTSSTSSSISTSTSFSTSSTSVSTSTTVSLTTSTSSTSSSISTSSTSSSTSLSTSTSSTSSSISTSSTSSSTSNSTSTSSTSQSTSTSSTSQSTSISTSSTSKSTSTSSTSQSTSTSLSTSSTSTSQSTSTSTTTAPATTTSTSSTSSSISTSSTSSSTSTTLIDHNTIPRAFIRPDRYHSNARLDRLRANVRIRL